MGKKTVVLLYFFVFSCIASLTAYSYAAENLLQNPDFEGKEGWNIWGKETWTKEINSKEEKHSGNTSFKVVIEDAKPWDSTIAEQIIKDVPAESHFEATVWVMVPQKTPLVDTLVYLEVILIKEDGSEFKKFQSVKYDNQAIPQWQKLAVSGTIPSGIKALKYWLVIAPQQEGCSGTVYFDDARLEITLPKKPL
ncbi:MAG: hypothetical protein Q8O36_02005 [Candidatus Omnitrophota bacterium]|nr:hypothetical protein [Candidatus Omnitrophota bacterium]